MKKQVSRKARVAPPDIINQHTGQTWIYSGTVKDHFFHPRNFLANNPKAGEYDAEGAVGSPACGDVMRMWLKVGRKSGRIQKLKWRTFGCASAIAATSMFSVMVTENRGLAVEQALNIKPQDITARLGGLPNRKIHCSVLADKAFREAVNDFFQKTGQVEKMLNQKDRIIDSRLNITERDIEQAVRNGTKSLQGIQQALKAGVGDPQAIPQIEQLIRFYVEKHISENQL